MTIAHDTSLDAYNRWLAQALPGSEPDGVLLFVEREQQKTREIIESARRQWTDADKDPA